MCGNAGYNSLGLTTQLSNTIQIGKNVVRPAFQRGQYTISFIKQNNIITKENVPLLQILDAIRYIKKIPDTTISESGKRLSVILKNLSDGEKSTLVRLAMKYPPSARALLGTLLDSIQADAVALPLYNSLNPITKYRLPGLKNVFPESDKWNFI